MKPKYHSHRYLLHFILLFFIAIGLAACTTIKLIGDYDEQIDKGTTTLQREVESFLTRLESSTKKPDDKVAGYSNNKQFYSDIRIAISGLRIRADAMERNSITVRAFDKISANINLLEKMHKEGITQIEIAQLIRPGFTQQFTAILTFELAKRRGEKPDSVKSTVAPSPVNVSKDF
jgi:hypothetical protein